MEVQNIEWIEMAYANGWSEGDSDAIVWIEIARINTPLLSENLVFSLALSDGQL